MVHLNLSPYEFPTYVTNLDNNKNTIEENDDFEERNQYSHLDRDAFLLYNLYGLYNMENKVILYYTNIIYIRRDDGQCHPYVPNRSKMRFPNYEKHSIKKKTRSLSRVCKSGGLS